MLSYINRILGDVKDRGSVQTKEGCGSKSHKDRQRRRASGQRNGGTCVDGQSKCAGGSDMYGDGGGGGGNGRSRGGKRWKSQT